MTIALVAAALGPVLIVVGKVISAVGTIMTIVPKISGAITAVKTAFAALNVTMLANPIVFNHCSDYSTCGSFYLFVEYE